VLDRVAGEFDYDYGHGASLSLFVSDNGREIVLTTPGGTRCLDAAERVEQTALQDEMGYLRALGTLVRSVCASEGRYRWTGGAYARVGVPGDTSSMRAVFGAPYDDGRPATPPPPAASVPR
jgi:hypothetical protein